IVLSGRPSTPPAALISLIAKSKPFFSSCPSVPPAPDNGLLRPMTIGSPVAGAFAGADVAGAAGAAGAAVGVGAAQATSKVATITMAKSRCSVFMVFFPFITKRMVDSFGSQQARLFFSLFEMPPFEQPEVRLSLKPIYAQARSVMMGRRPAC